MNAPDRFDRFVVPENLKKVAYSKDSKLNNAGTLVFQREDHTIGNLLRVQLLEDEDVIFAGYKIPHPLQYQMIVRVQTMGREQQSGRDKSPLDATVQAFDALSAEFAQIGQQFENESTRFLENNPMGVMPMYPSGMQ